MTPAEHTHVSAFRAIRLAARREIVTRVRSKSFIISTAITLGIIVIASFANQAFADEDKPTALVVGDNNTGVVRAIEQGSAAIDKDVLVQTVGDTAEGRALVEDGKAHAFVRSNGDRLDVVVNEKLDSDIEGILQSVSYRLALDRQIVQLGGDPAAVDAAVTASNVNVEAIDPPPETDGQDLALGSIAGIIIYIALLITGQMVAQGVVEEKASRVVEVLLATIPATQLLAGKVIGIGMVGLLQVTVIGVGGALAGIASGSLDISISAAGSTVAWLVVWFILGYTFYSFAFAAAGALVSRQEEVGTVTMPVMMFLIGGYFIGISVLPSDPGNRLAEVLSMVPLFAPTLMPIRLGIGGVPVWQAALAVGLVVLCIPGLVWLSALVYRRAIVRTGSRAKLLDVLRAK